MVEPEKKMFVSAAAGIILSIFGRKNSEPKAEDLAKHDFKISTQMLGVRFSDKVRNVFRFKWLRKV